MPRVTQVSHFLRRPLAESRVHSKSQHVMSICRRRYEQGLEANNKAHHKPHDGNATPLPLWRRLQRLCPHNGKSAVARCARAKHVGGSGPTQMTESADLLQASGPRAMSYIVRTREGAIARGPLGGHRQGRRGQRQFEQGWACKGLARPQKCQKKLKRTREGRGTGHTCFSDIRVKGLAMQYQRAAIAHNAGVCKLSPGGSRTGLVQAIQYQSRTKSDE